MTIMLNFLRRLMITAASKRYCLNLSPTLLLPRWQLAILGSVLLNACSIGPERLASSRMAYNEAVQITEQRELLLNIVRLRYHETPEFLAINSISSQFELTTTVGVSSELDGDAESRSTQAQVELGFAERPTITFTPQQGQEFTRQLTAPVGPETLYRLIEYGWGLDRIFELTVRQINSVGTPIGVAREASESASSTELLKIISTLAKWQREGLVTLSLSDEFEDISALVPAIMVSAADIVEAAKSGYHMLARDKGYVLAQKVYRLTLKVDSSLRPTLEWQHVARSLGIEASRHSYAIDLADKDLPELGQPLDTLYIATRSPLGIMAYLAQGVTVPAKDSHTQGAASIDASMSTLFRIKTADQKPDSAYIAVPHRGRWFYIQAEDLASRRSLGALISLLRLELEAGGAQNVPTLTLPVGL